MSNVPIFLLFHWDDNCISAAKTHLLSPPSLLPHNRPQLGSLQHESGALVKIISETSGLAENISVKVRQLDLEQSRVQLAIKHVEDVQELKYCISGIQRAMDQLDYEDAARHMHKALGFDKAILQGSFAEISVVRELKLTQE